MKQQYLYPALSKLKGRILEVGFGKGESVAYYSDNCEVFALEKSDKKIEEQKNNVVKYKNVKFFKGKAESLPFEDGFFDAVVVSLVLCSVDSIEMAINEIRRVLKIGGKFILLEHIRSGNRLVGKLQDIITTPCFLLDNNCHLNRNPLLWLNRNIFDLFIEAQIPYFLGTRLIFAKAYKNFEAWCER